MENTKYCIGHGHNLRGLRLVLFGLGVPYFHFQDTGEEFAVTRRNLRRLLYTKTVFGRVSGADLARELISRLGARGLHVLPS